MKKNILLLVLAIILFEHSYGQVTRESFEKAVDLLNCRTVELSLKDDKNFSDFQNTCPCNKSSYKQISYFLNSVNISATLALSAEIESLKSSFIENWTKDKVVTFLSEDIFADKIKFEKINAFAEKRKDNPEFNTYKTSLKTDLSKNLIENLHQEAKTNYETQQSTIENRILELEKKQKSSEEKLGLFGSFSDYLILLAILLGILAVFLALRKRDSYEKLMPRILNSNRLINVIRAQSTPTRGPQNNQSVNSDLRDANNRIGDLDYQIKVLKEKVEELSKGKIVQQTSQFHQEVRQPEPKTEILFLSTPNSDGSFNESSASNIHKDGATIYKLIKTQNDKAKFHIDEKESSIKLALQYPDKNIDPVCDAENAFNPRATRILTIKLGEAELRGDKWIINVKAIIRYED
ncbi:hypothetical protein KXJ69_05465 [Aureisphaera sp. CAU 1614]|uniref:Uncharacterized protein n=1 Tax=Halomarinibacterium sedimenti TaxID=2857106 RepID=A0A9X1FMT7_9FLAO|nr:hypothetical protein [Halomarinibacterium sedimenti]MBW2937543.1 hypothetical protein [Halomarinibacterium sedimenti]